MRHFRPFFIYIVSVYRIYRSLCFSFVISVVLMVDQDPEKKLAQGEENVTIIKPAEGAPIGLQKVYLMNKYASKLDKYLIIGG